MTDVARWVAFSADPAGGNPAGVVLDATGLDDAAMLTLAAEVGYSETAFARARGGRAYDVRYFSPQAEVPFCGHATIATAAAIADRDGPGELRLHTAAGLVVVDSALDEHGVPLATLTSVAPSVHPAEDVDAVLALLRWDAADLDPALPPRVAFAGARHLILAAATRARLADLDYDFDGLRELMLRHDLTTVDLVWREDATTFHARNPFPVGGVVEDPATGAAAAAFGAYLRDLGAVGPGPVSLTIHQGEDLGRPSLIQVDLDDRPEVRVTGRAVRL